MTNKYKEILPTFLTNPNPNIYQKDNYVVLDFETTNIDKGDPTNPENKLVLACWYSPVFGHKYSWNDEYRQTELLEDISNAYFLVAHNTKFELGWLKRCGLDLETVIPYCTQIGEYTIAGNRKWPFNLESTLKRRGIGSKHNLGRALVHGGICPTEVPRSVLLEYCKQDVEVTDILFQIQREELFDKGLEKVAYTRNLFTCVLADIEFNGLQLDSDRVEKMYRETYEELKDVERRLNELTGGINPRSSKQMAEFIFDTLGFAEPKDWKGNPIRTASGQRSVSEEVIGKLQARNRRQRTFIGLKKSQGQLQARVSKYLEKFNECCKEAGGNFKINFNQTIAQTGRLTSNGKRYKVQGQNIQRDLKSLFRCKYENNLLQERDYAQLEFRVAGELSGDPQIFRDVEEKADIHSYTASVLTESGQPTDRQGAKSHTFKPLYGGSSGTDAEKSYYAAFKTKYNYLTRVQDEWVNVSLKSKELRVGTGLIFYFPDLKVTRNGYISGNTKVRDYPIQYFATGEIVPIGVTLFWHYLKALKCKSHILNTIHDSVVNELFPEEKELVDEVAVEALTVDVKEYISKLYGIDIKIPLEIDKKEHTHWGKTKEEIEAEKKK